MKCTICGNKTDQYFCVCESCRKLSILVRLRALIRWDRNKPKHLGNKPNHKLKEVNNVD